jgi:DNA-binding response OmpR family regulator
MPRRTGEDYIRLLFAMSSYFFAIYSPLPASASARRFWPPLGARAAILSNQGWGNAVSEAGIGILIIDDDLESQLALRYVLDAEDWRVRVVPLVHHGLADLATGDWSLVLVNVALTDLSGEVFEMLKDLAQADVAADGRKSVRVLFLIPGLLAKEAKPVMDQFSLPYVLKPFHLNDFLDKVGDLLIEAQVLKNPIRQIRPEPAANERRKKDRRAGQERRLTMFASREDCQMSEEDLLEFERQEQEEQKKKELKEKQLENL